MQQRFKFIHWMVNQNARRKADKAEHERLKQYYANKLRGPVATSTSNRKER